MILSSGTTLLVDYLYFHPDATGAMGLLILTHSDANAVIILIKSLMGKHVAASCCKIISILGNVDFISVKVRQTKRNNMVGKWLE